MKNNNWRKWRSGLLMVVLCVTAVLGLFGCTTIDLTKGTARSFGVIRTFDELSVTIETNGVRTITVKGYTSDQSQVIGMAVEAAVKAGAKAATGH